MTRRGRKGKPIGGVFVRTADGVDARKLIAKICDDGKIAKADARTASGTEVVGFAVHAPRNGFWAIIDSADGALGIGTAEASNVSFAANHLGTDAYWYRVYTPELALAVIYPHGSTWLRAYAGTADEILARLEDDRVPVRDSPPPCDAEQAALLVAVAYESGKYATGPDAALAARLLAVHEALVAGDASGLEAQLRAVPAVSLPLALGIVRGADREAWQLAIQRRARAILSEPPRMRTKLQQMTADEEILRRAAELAGDEAERVRLIDHLDAIEVEAEGRSSHAHAAGIARLADHLHQRGAPAAAFECCRRLVRRPAPAWNHVNFSLLMLLQRASKLVLDGEAREVIRCTEARLPELGQSAIDAIAYNLACVYARAGEVERALVALHRCEAPKKQNPHPEQDTDLEPLWTHAEFQALVGDHRERQQQPRAAPVEAPYVVPRAYAVPRLAIELTPRPEADRARIDRLGGKPNAPTPDFEWPSSPKRPMQLIVQLVGRAGGGAIELGDIHVLQIFADLAGDYFEPSWHQVVAHRVACPAVVEPPTTVETGEVKAITLVPGFDDLRLLDPEVVEREGCDAAHAHAWCDKVGGVRIGANLDPDPRDSANEQMQLVLELVTYDGWFLWALFASRDFRELRLDIERG